MLLFNNKEKEDVFDTPSSPISLHSLLLSMNYETLLISRLKNRNLKYKMLLNMILNKCSDRSMEVKQTNQPTDRPTDGQTGS